MSNMRIFKVWIKVQVERIVLDEYGDERGRDDGDYKDVYEIAFPVPVFASRDEGKAIAIADLWGEELEKVSIDRRTS